MSVFSILASLLSFVIALVGTGLVRRYALAARLLDVPNERSSHAVATPRSGGLALVAATVVACALFAFTGRMQPGDVVAWLGGGLIVAAVGLVDDRRGLSARVRMVAHLAAALLLVHASGLGPLPWPGGAVDLGWIGLVIALLAVISSINLFNFMDGTDGIAATQCVFVFSAAIGIGCAAGVTATGPWTGLWLCLVGAAFGFLAWNRPPARIFMGDVGSGYLGYLIAAGALLGAHAGGLAVWVWVILHGVFLSDACVTLATRALRGEKLSQAHRSHAYQRLARRWHSHARVLYAQAAINLLWLLPWGVVAAMRPAMGPVYAAIALLPLVAAAMALGAGRAEPKG